MSTKESLTDKIEVAFKKLPSVHDQKRCLENLTIVMEKRIEEENKALQEAINENLKLKSK